MADGVDLGGTGGGVGAWCAAAAGNLGLEQGVDQGGLTQTSLTWEREAGGGRREGGREGGRNITFMWIPNSQLMFAYTLAGITHTSHTGSDTQHG